jgi:hypothetical protein
MFVDKINPLFFLEMHLQKMKLILKKINNIIRNNQQSPKEP